MTNPFENLDEPDPVPSNSRMRSSARKQRPHIGPLLISLAILSFFGPFFVAPVAWLLARHCLKEMASGRMDRAGRPQTQTAQTLAIISTCLWLLIVSGFLVHQFIAGGDFIAAVGSRRITEKEFNRVRLEMTEKQVADILGQPARTDSPHGQPTWYWYEKNGRATFMVEFDDKGRVCTRGSDTPD
jgi:hypothetical protein